MDLQLHTLPIFLTTTTNMMGGVTVCLYWFVLSNVVKGVKSIFQSRGWHTYHPHVSDGELMIVAGGYVGVVQVSLSKAELHLICVRMVRCASYLHTYMWKSWVSVAAVKFSKSVSVECTSMNGPKYTIGIWLACGFSKSRIFL